MTPTPDSQALWQTWQSLQPMWNQWINQQPNPLIQSSLKKIQDVSTLYQEIAQTLLPHATQTPPTKEDMARWLSTIHEKMSTWATQQNTSLPTDTTQVFQAQLQQWTQVQQAIQRYQTISTEYQKHLEQLNQQVLSTLQQQFLSNANPPDITSVQGLMNEWGKVYEDHYQQWTSSDAYQTLYGELTNAGINLKAALQTQLQPLLQWLDVPTQTDLKTVYERFHELRRDNQTLKLQVEQLSQQVQALMAKG